MLLSTSLMYFIYNICYTYMGLMNFHRYSRFLTPDSIIPIES
jgi:hypothetical protein